MTAAELAEHLRTLAALLDRGGDRRINGLTLDVCDGIEIVVPSAAAERQRRSRRKGTGVAPPGVSESVTESVTPDAQKRGLRRNENVTGVDDSDPPLAPPLHSPSLPTLGFSALSSSSKTDRLEDEDEERGVTPSVTETRSMSVTERIRIPCPPSLTLLPAQVGTLETSLIGRFHINAMTVEYVAKYAGDESELRTIGEWRRGLVRTITSSWNDPRQRRMPTDGEPARPRPVPSPATESAPRPALPLPSDERRLVPRPAVAGPRKSREEALADLERATAGDASSGQLEAVADA